MNKQEIIALMIGLLVGTWRALATHLFRVYLFDKTMTTSFLKKFLSILLGYGIPIACITYLMVYANSVDKFFLPALFLSINLIFLNLFTDIFLWKIKKNKASIDKLWTFPRQTVGNTSKMNSNGNTQQSKDLASQIKTLTARISKLEREISKLKKGKR